MQFKHTSTLTRTLIDVRNVLIECDGVFKLHMNRRNYCLSDKRLVHNVEILFFFSAAVNINRIIYGAAHISLFSITD